MTAVLALVVVLLPLGLDSFALAAALAAAGLSAGDRRRLVVLVPAAEAGMPAAGALLGGLAGRVDADAAGWVAIAVLAGLGIAGLLRGDADELALARLARLRGLAAVPAVLAVSLDELALGAGAGLLPLPLAVVVPVLGVQALALTLLGLRVGSRIGEAARERSERLAALALLVAAAVLAAELVA